MDRKKFLLWIILLFFGLQLASCGTLGTGYSSTRASPFEWNTLDDQNRR
jgi:hypothetical protein